MCVQQYDITDQDFKQGISASKRRFGGGDPYCFYVCKAASFSSDVIELAVPACD